MASKAFGLRMTLLVRTSSGQADSWNQTKMLTKRVPVMGYFWQRDGADPDQGLDVTSEEVKVAFLPPKDSTLAPKSFHGIEFVLGGQTITWEFRGHPEPKFSVARGGKLHHYEALAERAEAA